MQESVWSILHLHICSLPLSNEREGDISPVDMSSLLFSITCILGEHTLNSYIQHR